MNKADLLKSQLIHITAKQLVLCQYTKLNCIIYAGVDSDFTYSPGHERTRTEIKYCH